MPTPPPAPKIYHILHIDRLPSVVADGHLWSDAAMAQRSGRGTMIGMSHLKERRLSLPVKCHAGTRVGEYVPFYFCPRSIMLFVIHKANDPSLAYRGGQGPIIHLEADLLEAVAWADDKQRTWAFSLSNASGRYAEFRSNLAHLDGIDWTAVAATDFRPSGVSDGKQAEFLMRGSFPWTLVRRIGVRSQAIRQQVAQALAEADHRPPVQVLPGWYY